MTKRLFVFFLLASTVVACASSRPKSAQEPATPAAAAGDSATGAPAGYPQQEPNQYAPPPPPQATTPAQTPASPEPKPQGGTSRALNLQQAANDIEAAQRELDVAGSSCQNACRALGSMDRAAGHLCQLTRDDNTHDRCDDAKRRLYGARDRVRNTCGQCPDNQPATDRNAPVPSVR